MGAENNIDAYSVAAIKVGPCCLPGARVGNFGGQVILPLEHTVEHEELLEVIKLEGVGHSPEDAIMPRYMYLLQNGPQLAPLPAAAPDPRIQEMINEKLKKAEDLGLSKIMDSSICAPG